MKSNKKSLRRHHYNRLKKKRAAIWKYYDYEIDDKLLGRLVATPKMCSLSCCNRTRKHFGKTLKEIEYLRVTTEDLIDYLSLTK